MKTKSDAKSRDSRVTMLQSRPSLKVIAPIVPFIPRQISYLEDLLGDG